MKHFATIHTANTMKLKLTLCLLFFSALPLVAATDSRSMAGNAGESPTPSRFTAGSMRAFSQSCLDARVKARRIHR
jgi:hypothetical protein